MKKILLSAVILSSIGLKAQNAPAVKTEKAVGIETSQPRATLDVNGDARLQKVEEMTSSTPSEELFPNCPCVLTIDKYGVIKRIPKDQFVLAGGSTSGGQGSQGGQQGGPGSGSQGSGSGSSQGGSQGGDNQSTGGANLGTSVHASINDQEEYVVSLVNPNIQGEINNSNKKVVVNIPYTNGNGAQYNTATSTTTTSSASSQNGQASSITMTIKQGALSSGSGDIKAEITTPSSYLVKKLAPGAEVKIAEFKYTINNETRKVVLKAIGGIPDKLYNKKTNNKLEHQFIYLPIQGPDGKTWLNNNLGAYYARVNNPVGGKFNPTRQATGKGDYNAYGSLFQWGRDADNGYELMTWTGTSSGHGTYQDKEWKSNYQLTDTNWNPCPDGYRLPTEEELENLRSHIGGSDPTIQSFASSTLKLPAANARGSATGTYFSNASTYGDYWSSTPVGSDYAKSLYILDGGSRMDDDSRSRGFSVRCLKN